MQAATTVNLRGNPAWERALVPRPPLPLKNKATRESFRWIVAPRSFPIVGAVYSDGSARDGPTPELLRCGWAFVIMDSNGEVVAAANGVTPPWIVDIGGAEVWALYQAILVTIPGQCKYWVDCLPVFDAIRKGEAVSRDPRNALARVHGMLFASLEEGDVEAFGWMPSHCKEGDLQHELAKKSDGSALASKDVEMNDLADYLAKEGVEQHRVPAGVVRAWKEKEKQVEVRARWIGIVTYEANSSKTYPFRDSEAARWKADAAQRRRREAEQGKDGRRRRSARSLKKEISPGDGGHRLVKAATGHGWICEICKKRSLVKKRLATKKCCGVKGCESVQKVEERSPERRMHVIRLSGTVSWCGICGAFAESRSQRLQGSCKGPPPVHVGGGLRAQLLCLRASVHPVTKERLPQATWPDGSPIVGTGSYLRLHAAGKGARPEGFIEYEPAELMTTKLRSVDDAAKKKRRLQTRVRTKVRQRARRLREQDAEAEAAELYADFLGQAVAAAPPSCRDEAIRDERHPRGRGEVEAEEFWMNLEPQPPRVDRFANIPTGTSRSTFDRGHRPSRAQRLQPRGAI